MMRFDLGSSPRAVDLGPDGSVYILEREGNTLRTSAPPTA